MTGRHTGAETPGYEEFVGALRSALHYLYDPVQLRRSPLVALLGLSGEFDRAAALQRLLTETIQKLKPADDESPQSPAWQIYDTLSLQYIRQFPRSMVANQLGISERQLRREQRTALEALAQRLWEKVERSPIPGKQLEAAVSPTPIEPKSGAGKDRALSEELGWLDTADAGQPSPLGEVLRTVLSLAQPLAERRQVSLAAQIEPELYETPVRGQALRHILLTLISEVISTAGQGQVSISAECMEGYLSIRIQAAAQAGPGGAFSGAGMDTARRLASYYGAALEVEQSAGGEPQTVSLSFHLPGQVPVLVIDDNADWLEMLKRFAAGSKYQIVGTREPEMACALAKTLQPAVIFLDVMMPGTDGWQILDGLRHDSATAGIPIVVCTVLPLQDLALSLGVNAFLQKPVTQDRFLNMVGKMIDKTSASTRPAGGAAGLA